MNRLVLQRLATSTKFVGSQARKLSTKPYHNDRSSPTPLMEHYRSAWPDFAPDKPVSLVPEIPERTVPDDKLRFTFTAVFTTGSTFFHPHLKSNPAGFKTILKVYLKDMPLDAQERQIFVRMVGRRLIVGNGEVKFTCDRFPNRLENKKYLMFQLEKLLAEAKRLNTLRDQYLE